MIMNIRKILNSHIRGSQYFTKFLRHDISAVSSTREVVAKSGLVSFGLDSERDLFFARNRSTGNKIYVSDRQRLGLYRHGEAYRQKWLLEDYCLPIGLISAGDRVIDVGANIGELGIWVESLGGHYMAFEPDPKVIQALRMNVNSSHTFDVALSDTSGDAKFYLKTGEADSSLFRPEGVSEEVTVRTIPLDDFMKDFKDWEAIKLMKIEAEGMEPEVIAGALETLKHVEYVAVDAGPERGGENTVPDVLNALSSLGFGVLSCYLKRGSFLLHNRNS